MIQHKTKKVVVKEAEVDEKMVPVIEWLNSFRTVVTFFCCQGQGGKTPIQPYVIFQCYEIEELLEILKTIRHYDVECIVDWQLETFPLRYWLKFRDTRALKQFLDGMTATFV